MLKRGESGKRAVREIADKKLFGLRWREEELEGGKRGGKGEVEGAEGFLRV
jgi:hypothetical protein